MSLNMDLVSEALPEIDESELMFGNKLPPMWEGTYAVRSTLGKNGMQKVVKNGKESYTIHAENVIIQPLKVVDPSSPERPADRRKVFFDDQGNGRKIHDFFRVSVTNKMGLQKAVQFLKYAGDPSYNSYKTPLDLATAVKDALSQEPDHIKISARWEASTKVGVVDGKDKYESVRGIKNFPLRADGSRSHFALIDDEQIPAQLAVVEYGEVTQKDMDAVRE